MFGGGTTSTGWSSGHSNAAGGVGGAMARLIAPSTGEKGRSSRQERAVGEASAHLLAPSAVGKGSSSGGGGDEEALACYCHGQSQREDVWKSNQKEMQRIGWGDVGEEAGS